MTKPKMVPCKGSGQKVYGSDEPTGTVYCSVCGNSALPMKTTVVDGKKEYSVPEHECRANPYRRKGAKTKSSNRRRLRRDSGRR
jgi:uncharacterized Zn finger protein (UPF0148 family)